MKIILLSGGSGKRLWPLSNDTRSKQFLKLLKRPDGQYESMVQRVYRQIRSVSQDSQITVATVASQMDSIKSQLGDHVDIVLEPERRDTFPAIALACAYLQFEKECPLDEVVMVMPVDTYAGSDYFDVLVRMKNVVESTKSDLVLMGINPVFASPKYGYIIPTKGKSKENMIENAIPVAGFVEKPDEHAATKLIAKGAFWNGGAFAFKLGYLMSIVGGHFKDKGLSPNSFEDMRANYSLLEKTSFDYAVVEKAASISMIPYYGAWKDLGTWNTLTDEMEDKSVGMVKTNRSTVNTHIINELSIPIIVLGARDMIIAACPDGILVSDKEESAKLKDFVDDVDSRPMYEEKRWGNYKVLDYVHYENGSKSLTKHMVIQAGKGISYQCHSARDEIWTITDGTGVVLIDDIARSVSRGDVLHIAKGQKHSIRADKMADLHFIEVQLGDDLVENDILRFGETDVVEHQ
ncbi:MAG: sugar phosphate nucleotidyltransferase [Eubacteriales bacterium]|nr:sugar phosphate nucleotidyltransferase [Eubacteriales bacterium]